MFLIRRAALRVLTPSPSLTITARPRSITTLTSFSLRSSRSAFSAQTQRRYASEDIQNADTERGPPDETEAVDRATAAADAESTTASSSGAPVVETYAPPEGATGTAGAPELRSERPVRQPPPPSPNLYLGNLYFDVTEEDLKREFSRFGEVTSVRIIYDGRGLSKGFGYVTMDNLENATTAIEDMNGQIFEGRRLSVQYSHGRNRAGPQVWNTPNGRQSTNEPSRTLYIGNMAFEMSDSDLNDLFKDIKNIIDVRVAIDRRTGQPRGFAHADFTDVESAREAMKYLKGKVIHGRRLRVDYTGSFKPTRPNVSESSE